MTISSSLNASVAGLTTTASQLATISDNIANSSTYGYKLATTDFNSMVTASGSAIYTAGGVQADVNRLINQSGALIATANPTDLAVSGGGFLPVMSMSTLLAGEDGPLELATTGSFTLNADGYLQSTSGLVLLGWPADPSGDIPNYPRDTDMALEPIQVNTGQTVGEPTTEIQIAANLPATSTDFDSDGTAEVLTVEYFDNLGKSQTLTITYTPTVPGAGSSNEWTMVITDSAQAGATVGEYVLTFDDDRDSGGLLESVATVSGGAYDPATGMFEVTVEGGPIDIDIGVIEDPNGMTQLADGFSPSTISKNGFAAGNLISVEVDPNGYVYAVYDNGMSSRIYQVPVAAVDNPNGLNVLDGQTYTVSNQSGEFFLWDAGEGPAGDVISYAREASTTDIATELTSLIETQRAYSSNAKVVQTVDEMLQETTNIKR